MTIYNNDMLVYPNQVTYSRSFADVRDWTSQSFISIPFTVSWFAINQGSFAKAYNVGVGASWHIEIRKWKINREIIIMKQKSLFSIKDVCSYWGWSHPLCRDCYVANPCTCTEYEHSVAICPFKLSLSVVSLVQLLAS